MQDSETVEITCETCGCKVQRPAKYKEWENDSVFFRWKLKYCDTHFKERSDAAIAKLPTILNALITINNVKG